MFEFVIDSEDQPPYSRPFNMLNTRLALAIRQFAMGESEFKLAKNYVKKCFRISQTG